MSNSVLSSWSSLGISARLPVSTWQPHAAERLWLLAAVLLLCLGTAGAQTPEAQPATSSTAPGAASGSLSLLDAVRMTLSLQPEIRIAEQQIEVSRGVTQRATGQFDFNLQAGISQRGDTVPLSPLAQLTYSSGIAGIVTYTTSYNLGISKQFRFGMTASSSIQISRVAQNALETPYAQSLLAFSIMQPLLRGRGASSTAATESAARIEQEVSQLLLRHTIAQRIRDTCIAYWNYDAAYQSVLRWKEAEERAQLLLTEEERLVKAAEHPAAGLKLLAANLADIVASRAEAERQNLEARQALGLAMGLPWEQIERIAPPSNDFTLMLESSLPSGEQVEKLVKKAREQRADLLAADAEIRAAQVLSYASRRALEPRLDLQAELGYAGLSEGSGAGPFFSAPYDRVAGVNFLAGLTLQYPLQNNAARGDVVVRNAEQKRAMLVRDNLGRQIGSAVALLATSLRAAVATLQSADAAVAAYRDAVENERKKVRAGLTTLFDVIQIQGRLNIAEQTAIRARARVATLLSQARFESGALVAPKGTEVTLSLEQLTTLPTAH